VAQRIADESGGFASTIESPADFETAFDKLRRILRNSYTVEYKSDHSDKKTLQRPKVIAPGRKDVAVLVSISASR
jgi:hypothetical protein